MSALLVGQHFNSGIISVWWPWSLNVPSDAQGLPPGEMGSSSGSRDQSSASEQCVSSLTPPSSSALTSAKQSLRYRSNSTSAQPSRPSTDEQELVEEQAHRWAKSCKGATIPD